MAFKTCEEYVLDELDQTKGRLAKAETEVATLSEEIEQYMKIFRIIQKYIGIRLSYGSDDEVVQMESIYSWDAEQKKDLEELKKYFCLKIENELVKEPEADAENT